MSNLADNSPYRRPRRDIELGEDVLKPRRRFAEEDLGVSDKTVQRMDLPTTYIGGVAHVLVNAAKQVIAARVAQREQPKSKSRRRA